MPSTISIRTGIAPSLMMIYSAVCTSTSVKPILSLAAWNASRGVRFGAAFRFRL
jgi:hypothetical protein